MRCDGYSQEWRCGGSCTLNADLKGIDCRAGRLCIFMRTREMGENVGRNKKKDAMHSKETKRRETGRCPRDCKARPACEPSRKPGNHRAVSIFPPR